VRTMLGRAMQSMANTMRDFCPSLSSPMRVVCILPVTPYRPRNPRHSSTSRLKVGVFGYDICTSQSTAQQACSHHLETRCTSYSTKPDCTVAALTQARMHQANNAVPSCMARRVVVVMTQ